MVKFHVPSSIQFGDISRQRALRSGRAGSFLNIDSIDSTPRNKTFFISGIFSKNEY